jgi:CheY-like chemotaxis protein
VLGVSARKIHNRLKEAGPRPKRSPARKKAGSGVHAIPPGPAPVRVLVAEDDDELRGSLCDVLRRAGYDAVGAPDGRAVLEHLGSAMLLEQRDAPPDVILADVRMPGMTGVELLASVRDRGWTTPVLLMSAFGEADVRRQASDLGATAFLDKPIDTAKLEQLLRAAVA